MADVPLGCADPAGPASNGRPDDGAEPNAESAGPASNGRPDDAEPNADSPVVRPPNDGSSPSADRLLRIGRSVVSRRRDVSGLVCRGRAPLLPDVLGPPNPVGSSEATRRGSAGLLAVRSTISVPPAVSRRGKPLTPGLLSRDGSSVGEPNRDEPSAGTGGSNRDGLSAGTGEPNRDEPSAGAGEPNRVASSDRAGDPKRVGSSDRAGDPKRDGPSAGAGDPKGGGESPGPGGGTSGRPVNVAPGTRTRWSPKADRPGGRAPGGPDSRESGPAERDSAPAGNADDG